MSDGGETPGAELAALRAQAESLLNESVREWRAVADRYEVPYQSTCILVHPLQWTRGRTLLRFIAPLVADVPAAADLHARLSELNDTTVFGKFFLRDGTIFIEHNLLGESVDRAQFRAVLASVAHHGDHLSDLLLAEFGGRRWSERP